MKSQELDVIVDLGSRLPHSDVDKLVAAMSGGAESVRALRGQSAGGLHGACTVVLGLSAATPLSEICGVLQGASQASRNLRNRVDLVWTGPDIPGSASRLTSSVVADLVDAATVEILLISYAMHSESSLSAALQRAIDRGVVVHIFYERHEDNAGFSGWSVPFKGLNVRRLRWPGPKRPTGNASMHAKALIIDRRVSLIGSANVTDTAFLHNIEIGLIVRDQAIAREIVEAIETLTARGVLEEFGV